MTSGTRRGAFGRLARYARALPAVVSVLWWLAVVEVAVRTVPLPRLARWVGAPLATDGAFGDAMDEERAGSVTLRPGERRRLVVLSRVAPHWPLCEGPCLRQALAAGHILRRHRPALRIGAALDDRALRAHAWLEVDGATVGSAAGFEPLVAGHAP